MQELTRKQRIAIARRLREYAHFLRNYTSYTEMGKYEWDFAIFCTLDEISVHLDSVLDEFEEE